MKSNKILLYSLLVIIFNQGCKPVFDTEITVPELEETIGFLAGDSLKGRYPGTPEDSVLISFIIDKLDRSGMVSIGNNGKQEVKVESGFSITGNNRIIYEGNIVSSTDNNTLNILGFSSTDTVNGEIYISAGIANSDDPSIKGNILLLPLPNNLPRSEYDAYNYLRAECLKASDLGAAAVIYIFDEHIPALESSKKLSLPIPVAAMNLSLVSELFGEGSFDKLVETFSSVNSGPVATGQSITLETEVLTREISTFNTMAQLKGRDKELSDQFVIIGAHHDHLGKGGRGSSSRRQDAVAIHYGADDNASGVAGVIELAQNLMSRNPSRSFIFTTFAAEEMGLFGSKKFADEAPVDLTKVQVMINLDMIGRLNEERQLQIGGVGTSPVFRQLLDSLNTPYNFSMAYADAGYGPSDHSSFYAKDVPVLFISTGAHPDYHTPSDSPEKINYTGLEEVLYFVSDLAIALANLPDKIEFTLAGPKESSGSRSRMGMITFGLMPDVMYDGNEGMPVSFVTEGKPAAIGGMKGGDIITAIEGKSVGNVQDYMARLSDLKEGETVVVTIKRDGEQLELILKL